MTHIDAAGRPVAQLLVVTRSLVELTDRAVSDSELSRRNYLYSINPDRLSPAAIAVGDVLKETARDLVEHGEWAGVSLLPVAA